MFSVTDVAWFAPLLIAWLALEAAASAHSTELQSSLKGTPQSAQQTVVRVADFNRLLPSTDATFVPELLVQEIELGQITLSTELTESSRVALYGAMDLGPDEIFQINNLISQQLVRRLCHPRSSVKQPRRVCLQLHWLVVDQGPTHMGTTSIHLLSGTLCLCELHQQQACQYISQ
jgi:hypothetical protein